MASLQVSDGRKNFEVWRVAWNIFGRAKIGKYGRELAALHCTDLTGILDGFFGTIC
jgi:hypothetical protein